MPGQLIYRCYRLPGQGYVTLCGVDRDDTVKQADDAILDELRYGNTPVGCSGLVWTVNYEGREATEILAFIHGADLPVASQKPLAARLEEMKNRDLPEALDRIAQDNLARSAAVDRMAGLLDDSARAMSDLLPAKSLAQIAQPRSAAGPRWGRTQVIVPVSILLVLVFVGLAGFWLTSHENSEEARGPSAIEIAGIAEPCYPGISDRSEDIERLVAALEPTIWRGDDGPVRDYLRALPEHMRDRIRQPDLTPDALCKARSNMWKLQTKMGGAEAMLAKMKSALGKDNQDIPAIELLTNLVSFVLDNPIPEPPGDCAADLCLPLVIEADIALTDWVSRLFAIVAGLRNVDGDGSATQLRRDEVILRGELSLAGGDPKDAALNPFWTCDQKECRFPLKDATSWMKTN